MPHSGLVITIPRARANAMITSHMRAGTPRLSVTPSARRLAPAAQPVAQRPSCRVAGRSRRRVRFSETPPEVFVVSRWIDVPACSPTAESTGASARGDCGTVHGGSITTTLLLLSPLPAPTATAAGLPRISPSTAATAASTTASAAASARTAGPSSEGAESLAVKGARRLAQDDGHCAADCARAFTAESAGDSTAGDASAAHRSAHGRPTATARRDRQRSTGLLSAPSAACAARAAAWISRHAAASAIAHGATIDHAMMEMHHRQQRRTRSTTSRQCHGRCQRSRPCFCPRFRPRPRQMPAATAAEMLPATTRRANARPQAPPPKWRSGLAGNDVDGHTVLTLTASPSRRTSWPPPPRPMAAALVAAQMDWATVVAARKVR